MTGIITRRPRARDDLLAIWSYVAEYNEQAATDVLRKIEGVWRTLATHPQAGRARPELHAELRSFASGNYIVFYFARPDGIEVVRVLSGYLDLDKADFN